MTKLTIILKNIKNILNNICDINHKKFIKNISCFENNSIPNCSIKNYIKRIKKYIDCSDHVIVLAFIYIYRYIESNKLLIYYQSIHRLIITACIISSKFVEDDHYSNKYFSCVGGFSVAEINLLEREMLQGINYNLYVSKTEYYELLNELQKSDIRLTPDD